MKEIINMNYNSAVCGPQRTTGPTQAAAIAPWPPRWLEARRNAPKTLPPLTHTTEPTETAPTPTVTSRCLSADDKADHSDTQRNWPDEMATLVRWFATAALPTEAFLLYPWRRVTDPAQFYEALRRDIAQGPSGPRARHGTLQVELEQLRTLFGQEEQNSG